MIRHKTICSVTSYCFKMKEMKQNYTQPFAMTRFSLKQTNKKTPKRKFDLFFKKKTQIKLKQLTCDKVVTFSIFRYLIERQSFRKIHSSRFCVFVFLYFSSSRELHGAHCGAGVWEAGRVDGAPAGWAAPPAKGLVDTHIAARASPFNSHYWSKNRGSGPCPSRGSAPCSHSGHMVVMACRECSHNRF